MRKLLIIVLLLVAAVVAFDFLAPHTSAHIGLTLERSRSGLEAKTMKVGDWDIAYLEGGAEGEGVETLVLVHGFGADKDNFTRTSGYLTDRFHVVIPDLTGFGESTRLMDASYAIPDQAERLHTVLEAMGHKQYWMGGSSMGGAITVTYAAMYPGEVSGIWLLAPAGVTGSEDSDLLAEYKKTGKSLLVAKTPEDFDVVMSIAMHKPPFLPYSVKRVLAERAVQDHDLHLRIFHELGKTMDSNPYAAKVQAPALIMWGDHDRALHVSGATILDNLMPNSEKVVMQDIGHLPMMEAPREAAQTFLAFVDEVEAK